MRLKLEKCILEYSDWFQRKKINFYTDLPETEHVTSHHDVLCAETITAHSTPISTVIDLKSSRVVQSTAIQPYAFCM